MAYPENDSLSSGKCYVFSVHWEPTRYPLYSSLLFLAWGIFFKVPSWLGGLLALAATLFLAATARVEEAENLRYFGLPYRDYMRRTKMFVPFVF